MITAQTLSPLVPSYLIPNPWTCLPFKARLFQRKRKKDCTEQAFVFTAASGSTILISVPCAAQKKLCWSAIEVEANHSIHISNEFPGAVRPLPLPSIERETIPKPEIPRHKEVGKIKQVNQYVLLKTTENTKKKKMIKTTNPRKNKNIQKNKKLLKEIESLDDMPVLPIGIFSVHHSGVLPRFVVAVSLADSAVTIPILLDSGAGKSFIRRSVVDDLQLTDKIQQGYSCCVRDAFGQTQLVRHGVNSFTYSNVERVSFFLCD
jgi:hypothetical protein